MKFKNIVLALIFFLIFFFIFLIIKIAFYFYTQNENEKLVKYCNNKNENYKYEILYDFDSKSDEFIGVISNSKSCYCKMYSRLLPRLLINKVKSDNKNLEFMRISNDTYIIPTVVLDKADAFISYGIFDNPSFEDNLSNLYKKNTYAYDCGIRNIEQKNKYLFFGSECIGTDKYILTNIGQVSSKKIHTFGEKLKELNLENKKVFLKIDIAGAEIEVIPDILNYSKNLTGMALVIRLDDTKRLIRMNELLKMIEKDFVLVMRNHLLFETKTGCNCNYTNDNISISLSLTYINKNLVNKNYIPIKQDYSNKENYKQLNNNSIFIPEFYIDWVLVIAEKLRMLYSKVN